MNATLPSGLSRRAFALTLAIAALSAAALLATAAQAQTTGDPAAGKLLFDDTVNQTGNQMLTGNCTTCHSVLSRRNRLSNGGGEFAAVDPTAAQTRIAAAIANIPAMSQFGFLGDAEIRHIAAYIADTPKTSYAQLDFATSGVGVAQSLPLDLTNAVTNSTNTATGARITVQGVAISGADASDFSITGDTCTAQTLETVGAMNGNSTCRVTVRFTSAMTAGKTATLRFTLDPASSTTNFTRDVALSGVAAGAAPSPAPVGDDGGGALGFGWLAALAAAVAALRLAPRRSA